MKDYLNHFDIVWQGTEPLLPPRRSKPPRWWTMGGGHALMEQDPKEAARLRDAMRPKRAYNRRNHGRRVSDLPGGPAAPTGQPTVEGERAGGLSPEPVQDPTHHSQTATTE